MKTSYSRAWEMQACISDILTYGEYGDDITEPYIINQILAVNFPQQGARITPTSAPSNESVGEWGRRNDRMGR